MLRKILFYITCCFAPLSLRAWSNDIEIDFFRYADGKYPVFYDIAWPAIDNMVAAIGYHRDNNLYVNLYQSENQGSSWQRKYTITYLSHRLRKIQLGYYNACLYLMLLTENGELWLVLMSLEDLSYISGSQVVTGDSVLNASMSYTTRNDTLYMYIATMSRNSGFDKLRIYRSRGNSDFAVVYSSEGSNQLSFRELKDMSLSHKGDTIKIYYLIEEQSRSSGNWESLVMWNCSDKPNGQFYHEILGYSFPKYPTLTSDNPTLASTKDGHLLCIYEFGEDLKCGHSSDYGNHFTFYDTPLNTSDSTEWGPNVVAWSLLPYSRGFSLIFVRNNRIYFSHSTATTSSIIFETPVLVSDLYPVLIFPLREEGAFLPKLAKCGSSFSSTVMWARDFYRFLPPYYFYDSTFFYVDNSSSSVIDEGKSQAMLNVAPRFNYKGGILIISFQERVNVGTNGYIFQSGGQMIRKFCIEPGDLNYSLDISKLKPGVYFVVLERTDKDLVGKFIKCW